MQRSLATIVLLGLTWASAGSAAAQGGDPDPYVDMRTLVFAAHSHPGNVRMVECLADPSYDPEQSCCHSYHWCDEFFDAARANGLDALVQTHHASQLQPTRPQALDVWKSLGIGFQHAFGRQEYYPTHPDGIPLAISGGHSDDELRALWECAESKNVPGEFLAFFGIEYTASGAQQGSCQNTSGQARCGGHKTVIFEEQPPITCSSRPITPEAHRCESEGELYDLVRSVGGVIAAAHPTGSMTDFTPYDPDAAPGGLDNSLVLGYELAPISEDRDCENGFEGCGYRQALALGYRLHPVHGGDNHGNFGAEGLGCRSETDLPGTRRRGSCWVREFTRSGLIEAMREHRCFWTSGGDPRVQWTLGGLEMGRSAPLDLISSDSSLVITIERRDGGTLDHWELLHGDTAGGDGGARVLRTGPCEPDHCSAALALGNPLLPGWYYLRVLGPTKLVALTAPVWLTESASESLEIVAGPTGTPNPVASRGVAEFAIDVTGPGASQAGYQWSLTCPGLSWSGFLLGSTTATPTWFAPSNDTGGVQSCAVDVIIDDGSGAVASASLAQKILPEGSAADGDGDGLPDSLEAERGTDPGRADSDGDGDSDYVEVVAGSDPLAASDHLAPELSERPDGSVQLAWPGHGGVRYELLWGDGVAQVIDGTGSASLPGFTPFASVELLADGPTEYSDDGGGTGAPPQGADARLYALRVEGPDPVSGELVLVTGGPSGFVRVPLPARSLSLIGMPFVPADASLSSMLAGQLSGAADPQHADRVMEFDAHGRPRAAWLRDLGSGASVFMGTDGQPVEFQFGCGSGLLVDHRGTGLNLFLSGRLASRSSVEHLFAAGMRLFGPCYAVDGLALEDSGLAAQGAYGATSWTLADRVGFLDAESGRFEQFYLFDSQGADPARDGQWLPVEGLEIGPLRLQAGRGYTYFRLGGAPLRWSEARPYELP